MANGLAASGAAKDDDAVVSYFEVHARRGDRWVIDCTTQDAREALNEADELTRKSDVLAVKVFNERYDPRTDRSATRLIFEQEKPARKRQARPLMAAVSRPTVTAPRAADDTSVPSLAPLPPAAPPAAAPWLLFAWATMALAIGATALFVLLVAFA